WMCQAKRELGDRIMVLRQPRNLGKREALYRGIMRNETLGKNQQRFGDVLVTVDSDSIVEPRTLRLMCGGFVHDPRVGAVAGNVRVLNLHEGIIPRMLDVSFVFSFHFIRASQSLVNTVMCTPGALSAYRCDVLFKEVTSGNTTKTVLDEWVKQEFMGAPANIGEDRAMTNLILREGYYVHFQEDAVVYTKVPTTYRTLCNMLIRWARSNVRENLAMTVFTFRKFRDGPMSGARINLIQQLFAIVVPPMFLVAIMLCLFWRPHIFLLYILVGTAVWSSVPAVIYALRHRSSEALWAYAYGGFYFAALSWINAYSLFTMKRSGWLTRQTPAAPAAPPPVVK
ncbi:MAG: glycosyltransferase, partial [bacterium]